MELTLHFDGSCWPNPGGLAKYGYTLSGVPSGGTCGSGLVGENEFMSNNHAEFYAMAEGLEHCLRFARFHHVTGVLVVGDSEVATRIISGRYRANRQKLYYPQYVRAVIAMDALNMLGIPVRFKWVPREQNQEADDLSKLPINNASPELLEEAEGLLS
jgi:ribonuclease HI